MITQEEFIDTIDGFDELAVEKYFGTDLYLMSDDAPAKFIRALVFISYRHDSGMSDAESYQKAMSLSAGGVARFWDPDPQDPDPLDPDSDAGKDDSAPENEQTN